MDRAVFMESYFKSARKTSNKYRWNHSIELWKASLWLGAAGRCAGHAVEPLCLAFRNTWAVIPKIQNYMQILFALCDFLLLAR